MKFYEFFIALRYMSSNIKQSLIISGAVSIGVSIIVFIPSINLSFFNDLLNKTVSSAPHIVITKELETFKRDVTVLNKTSKTDLLLEDQTRTRRRDIKSYKNVLDKIKPIAGIVATAPFASGNAIITRGAEERGVSLKGIIPEDEIKVVEIQKDMKEGRVNNLGITDVVIGDQLADKLNVKPGDRVNIVGPRGISKDFKIVGIFSTGLRAKDEGQIYVNLKSGQQLLKLGTDVNGIGIKVIDMYQAETIAGEIQQATNLDARSWMEDNKQILEQLTRFRLIIGFINFLIIFAAASSITSVFIMLIAAKRKEIGILKSMGAKNLSIMFIFISQAIILGVLGYLFGLIGAQGLIIWYSNLLSSSTGTLLGTTIPKIIMNRDYALLALFYTMLTSLLASIIPAYQAAKLNPVEAINE